MDETTLRGMIRALETIEANLALELGRRPVALKLGRRSFLEIKEAIALRDAVEGQGPQTAIAPLGPLAGLPVYVCDAEAHWEYVFEDENLQARLTDAPAVTRTHSP